MTESGRSSKVAGASACTALKPGEALARERERKTTARPARVERILAFTVGGGGQRERIEDEEGW